MSNNQTITIYETADDACSALAQHLAEFAATGGTIALSGGTTPQRMFAMIAELDQTVDWSRVKFFWGDERRVPESSPESNYGEFRRTLIDTGVIAAAQCFPFNPENDELTAVHQAESMLRDHVTFRAELPQFDLVILGIGEDGHTASIFPDNIGSFHSNAMVQMVTRPHSDSRRITLTGSTINNARQVAILCVGHSKCEIVSRIIDQKDQTLPASHIRPQGAVRWFLDRAAAGKNR